MCLQLSIRRLLIIAIIIIYSSLFIPNTVRREISSSLSRWYDQLTHYKYQSSANTVSAFNVKSSVAGQNSGCSGQNSQGQWTTVADMTESNCRDAIQQYGCNRISTTSGQDLCKCLYSSTGGTNNGQCIHMYNIIPDAPTTAPTSTRVCSTKDSYGMWKIYGSRLESVCIATRDCLPFTETAPPQYLCKCTTSYYTPNGLKLYCTMMFRMLTNAPTAHPTTTPTISPKPTLAPTIPRGQGCSTDSRRYSNTKTIIPDKISACAGIIREGGVYGHDAELLCGRGYHVCRGEYEVKALDLTSEMCKNKVATSDNEFFATQETSPTEGQCKCYSQYQPTLDKSEWHGRNDIWGCAKRTANCHACGVLTASIGGVIQKERIPPTLQLRTVTSRYNHWDVHQHGTDDKHEATHATLSKASSGGVLCCID